MNPIKLTIAEAVSIKPGATGLIKVKEDTQKKLEGNIKTLEGEKAKLEENLKAKESNSS